MVLEFSVSKGIFTRHKKKKQTIKKKKNRKTKEQTKERKINK